MAGFEASTIRSRVAAFLGAHPNATVRADPRSGSAPGTPPVSWVDPPRPTVPLRTLRIDRHRIAYRLAGEGPLLLLLHGMAGSSATWRHVMPLLISRFTVLAPDLLGHGGSDTPRGAYPVGSLASTVDGLLDALGFARATMIGQSLGGGIAMHLAVRSPERCERLVLVDAGGLGPEVTTYLRVLSVPGVERLFRFAASPGLRRRLERAARRLERAGLRAGPEGEEIWQSYASLTDPEKRRVFFRSLRGVIDFRGQMVSALDQIARTDLPTLIVWGALDPFVPLSHGVTARAVIENSRLEIFEGVGHYPHCAQPERFVQVLVDFIEATPAARLAPLSSSPGDRIAP